MNIGWFTDRDIIYKVVFHKTPTLINYTCYIFFARLSIDYHLDFITYFRLLHIRPDLKQTFCLTFFIFPCP